MKNRMNYIEEMIANQDQQLAKLHEIVENSIREETLLTKKIAAMSEDDTKTLGERLADKVAAFGGSWRFIIFFIMVDRKSVV
jgi:uncharacterized membrane protein